MNGSTIQMKKVIVTIIWGVNGFYIGDFLQENELNNSSYFYEHILGRLYEMKGDIWSESDTKKIGYAWIITGFTIQKRHLKKPKSAASKELLI